MGRRSHTRTLGLWMNGARVGTWVSVQPSHLEQRGCTRDDGAHQYEQVGTYAVQIPEARTQSALQNPFPATDDAHVEHWRPT